MTSHAVVTRTHLPLSIFGRSPFFVFQGEWYHCSYYLSHLWSYYLWYATWRHFWITDNRFAVLWWSQRLTLKQLITSPQVAYSRLRRNEYKDDITTSLISCCKLLNPFIQSAFREYYVPLPYQERHLGVSAGMCVGSVVLIFSYISKCRVIVPKSQKLR
jgi:hypothetical protein